MIRSRSRVPLLVACATLLAGASVDGASAQVNTLDFGKTLQKALTDRNGRELPAPPAPPERAAAAPSVPSTGFTLVGVVIAGPTRLALLQEARAKHGGAHLLRIGASLGGLQLTDVQADHVTLEGSGGERVTVRLNADAGAGSLPVAATPRPQRAPLPQSAIGEGAGAPQNPAAEQERRRARAAERAAREKAREAGSTPAPRRGP
jgi:hypothetical protein